MNIIIILVGIFICLVSIGAAVVPGFFIEKVGAIKMKTPLRLFSAAMRIALGALLYSYPGTKYILTVQVIGALIFFGGVILIFMKNAWVQALIDWVLARPPYFLRAGGLIGFLFGVFIIYAGYGF